MAKYVVRYGSMRQLGVMGSRPEALRRGDRVIARTPRGVEVADVLCEATEDALAHLDNPPSGQILRRVEDDDLQALRDLDARRNEFFDTCHSEITSLALAMKLIDVELLFGGDRVVVYYLSEDRVDFRELVRILNERLKTRVEMRQVGIRDEAKLLADYGDCGKPVCCNTHLSQMPPVSMKMAKLQKATLDPTKISGRCGRLKCCLRYEYDTYEAIARELPPIGSEILTREGRGRVIGQEILAEQLLIETEDHRRKTIHATEVLTVVTRGSNRQARGGGRGRESGPGERRGNERVSERQAERAAERERSERARRPLRDEPHAFEGLSDSDSEEELVDEPLTDESWQEEETVADREEEESPSDANEEGRPRRRRRRRGRGQGGRPPQGDASESPEGSPPAESSDDGSSASPE